MKQLLILLFSFVVMHTGTAQIFKKVGDKITRDAEWRLRYKADQQVNRGLDSILQAPKKIIDKKKAKQQATENAATANNNSNNSSKKENQNAPGNITTSQKDDNDLKATDGFITLQLSTNTIFTGGSILISGESIKYKNYQFYRLWDKLEE